MGNTYSLFFSRKRACSSDATRLASAADSITDVFISTRVSAKSRSMISICSAFSVRVDSAVACVARSTAPSLPRRAASASAREALSSLR